MTGPEDTSKWDHPSNSSKAPAIVVCRKCNNAIETWHCADSGCPWCSNCNKEP